MQPNRIIIIIFKIVTVSIQVGRMVCNNASIKKIPNPVQIQHMDQILFLLQYFGQYFISSSTVKKLWANCHGFEEESQFFTFDGLALFRLFFFKKKKKNSNAIDKKSIYSNVVTQKIFYPYTILICLFEIFISHVDTKRV